MAKIQLRGTAVKKVPAKKPLSKTTVAVTKPSATVSGLSIKQVLKATPPYIKANAEEVIIKALKPATTKGGLPGIRAKVLSVGGKVKDVYDTTIIGKEKGIPVWKQKHVLFSCSCSFFCFYSEYALAHWGSAVIKYSNGEPATTTNPSNQPLCCKHLVKLAETVLREQM